MVKERITMGKLGLENPNKDIYRYSGIGPTEDSQSNLPS